MNFRIYLFLFVICSVKTLYAIDYNFETQVRSNSCDPGIDATKEERVDLLNRMYNTDTGKNIIELFVQKFGSIEKLIIQWDHVSYSQVIKSKTNRSLASTQPDSGASVCVHLTKKLPKIEHIADLSHEMTHATLMDQKSFPETQDSDTEEFVKNRIAGKGGEAEAFAVECMVKYEILKQWDQLCAPFVKGDKMHKKAIVSALYDGTLSASLTGEPYPVMLTKQFRNIASKKEVKSAIK